MYGRRDEAGRLLQVSLQQTAECTEVIQENDPELLIFIQSLSGRFSEFMQSDLEFIRVLDDLIATLLDQSLISFTDLPDAAQQKLMQRQHLRKRKQAIHLIDD